MKTIIVAVSVGIVTFGWLQAGRATDAGYPSRSIELTIAYAPGAGTDLATRMIAEKAKKILGQELVCVNKPGGGGRVPLTLISNAKPDGYNVAAVADGPIVLTPHLEKVPYTPEDFTYISQFGVLDFGIVTMANSPFQSLKEMLDFAQANPNELTIGTPGAGTSPHIAFEAIARMKQLKMKLVPFPGAQPAITALLGGHVQAATTSTSGYATYLKAKTVRLIGMMMEERSRDYPDVPTLVEMGYPLALQSWYLFVGPKNMDKGVAEKLADVFKKAMDATDYTKFAKDLEMWTKTPLQGEALRARVLDRYKKNGEVFKRIGMAIK